MNSKKQNSNDYYGLFHENMCLSKEFSDDKMCLHFERKYDVSKKVNFSPSRNGFKEIAFFKINAMFYPYR